LLPVISTVCISLYIAGCVPVYKYEVRGRIKKSIDGTPLAGVAVTIKRTQAGVPPKFPYAGDETDGPTISAEDGSFSLRFDTYEGTLSVLPKWSLILKKERYADEVIDISPDKEPAIGSETHLIAVAAYMRVQP
jgi:hypothetical protein